MIFIGVDPGGSGSICAVDEFGVPFGEPFWIKTNEPPADLVKFIGKKQFDANGKVRAVLERVGAMPGQGVSSTFKFGQSFGMLLGILVAMEIPFELYTPQVWQKLMGCRWPAGKTKPTQTQKKNLNKEVAQRLWPKEKITHANADGLLLAEFCRRIHQDRGQNG